MTTGSTIFNDSYDSTHLLGSYGEKSWIGTDNVPGTPFAVNSYFCMFHEFDSPEIIMRYIDSGDLVSPDGTYGYFSTFNVSTDIADPNDNNHSLKIINHIADVARQHEFNGGNFLGEGHQTIRLIGDTAKSIAGAIHALRRGDVIGATRELGVKYQGGKVKKVIDVPQEWLKLQYGWKPLLSDAYQGALAVEKLFDNTPITNSYNSTTKSSNFVVYDYGPNTISTLRTVSTRVHLEYRVKNSDFSYKMGLDDPLSVLWEVTPFSFIADWFLPIGDYLSAKSAEHDLEISNGYSTTKQVDESRHVAFNAEWLHENWGQSAQLTGAPYRKITTYTRSPGFVISVPPPNVKPLIKSLSVQHLLNSTALLLQAFK